MAIRFTSPHAIPPEPTVDIILASQSLGRRMLLEKLGVRFRVIATGVNEDVLAASEPINMIKKRAAAKADAITNHLGVYGLSEKPKALVVSADSMAILGKKAFGKPADRESVQTMLRLLMGKTHIFVTSVVIVYLEQGKEKKRLEKTIQTKVTLRKLTTPELDSYTARYDLSRFAGAYAVNDAPWDLVTKIDGSYTNVIGLPLEVLLPVLRQLKIIV